MQFWGSYELNQCNSNINITSKNGMYFCTTKGFMTNPAELEFSYHLFQITLNQRKSRPTCADSHSQPKKQPLNYVYSHFQPRPPNCIDSAQIMLLILSDSHGLSRGIKSCWGQITSQELVPDVVLIHQSLWVLLLVLLAPSQQWITSSGHLSKWGDLDQHQLVSCRLKEWCVCIGWNRK